MAAETRTHYYKYTMQCELLIPNKDPVLLNKDNILSFGIEKDFDNDYFPIFNIKLSLTYPQYYDIIDNKTIVKFKVKIEKHMYDQYIEDMYKEVVIDSIFSIFINDNTPFFDKELYNKTVNTVGTVQNRGTYDFYLFKESDIDSSKKIINRVVDSANMTDCLVYLFSKSGTSKLLLSPLDNRDSYSEIILPPLTVIQSINYLEKQYGFYNHGATFFYDFDTLYFINKRAECTAYRTGEYKDVIVQVFKTLNPNSSTPGNFKDTKTKTYSVHVTRDCIRMNTASIINDQIYGTNVNIIDPKNNESTIISPNIQSRNKTNTYIVNNFGNRFLPNMIENSKYENDNIVTMAVKDVDINCFTPNKKYMLSFEEKEINEKHKGNYRLSYTLFTFYKNGDSYVLDGEFELKRTK